MRYRKHEQLIHLKSYRIQPINSSFPWIHGNRKSVFSWQITASLKNQEESRCPTPFLSLTLMLASLESCHSTDRDDSIQSTSLRWLSNGGMQHLIVEVIEVFSPLDPLRFFLILVKILSDHFPKRRVWRSCNRNEPDVPRHIHDGGLRYYNDRTARLHR